MAESMGDRVRDWIDRKVAFGYGTEPQGIFGTTPGPYGYTNFPASGEAAPTIASMLAAMRKLKAARPPEPETVLMHPNTLAVLVKSLEATALELGWVDWNQKIGDSNPIAPGEGGWRYRGLPVIASEFIPEWRERREWHVPPGGRFTEYTESDRAWMEPLGIGVTVIRERAVYTIPTAKLADLRFPASLFDSMAIRSLPPKFYFAPSLTLAAMPIVSAACNGW